MTTDMIPLTDPKAAVPAILGNKDMLAAILVALRKDGMVARLGDGEVFFLSEKGTTKRGFKVKVDLAFPTHFCFPSGPDSKAMITAIAMGVNILPSTPVKARMGKFTRITTNTLIKLGAKTSRVAANTV